MRYWLATAVAVVAASVAAPSGQIGSVSDTQLRGVVQTYLHASVQHSHYSTERDPAAR